MTLDPQTVALSYVAACARHDRAALTELLAPQVVFEGPGNRVEGATRYLQVLERLFPVWLASEVRRTFVDGDDVCVIYDLVTDSPAGAVPIVEWLRVDGGRVASVRLYFDRPSFAPASEALAQRPQPTSPSRA